MSATQPIQDNPYERTIKLPGQQLFVTPESCKPLDEPEPKPAAFKKRDAAKWNVIHTRYLEAALNGAGYSKAVDRSIAMAIWNELGGRPQAAVSSKRIAARCNKSVDWVDLHMPGFVRRQLEMRNGLLRRVGVGRKGVGASPWNGEGMAAFINALHEANPKTLEEHTREGQRIACQLQLTEKEAAGELAKIEARKKRLKLAKDTKVETSVTEYLYGNSERAVAKATEKASMFSLTPEEEIQAYLNGLAPIHERMKELGYPLFQIHENATPVHDVLPPTSTNSPGVSDPNFYGLSGDVPGVSDPNFYGLSVEVPYDLFQIDEGKQTGDKEKPGEDIPPAMVPNPPADNEPIPEKPSPGFRFSPVHLPASSGPCGYDMDRDFDNVRAVLDNVKDGPSGSFTALCPAHDDTRRSLKVWRGDKRVRWTCYAGCNGRAIADAINELIPESQKTPWRQSTWRDPVAIYDYRDSSGALVFQKLRWEPKEFGLRQPDGAGGWTWNIRGVRRGLYGAEQLPERPDETVYLNEGERAADCLRSHGFLAVAVGGAEWWRDDMAQSLRGRKVVIIPDNDEPGAMLSTQVLQGLWGVAASVTELTLDGLDTGGDAVDWFQAGHSAEQLRELVNELA